MPIDETLADTSQDVAVIGMAGRFPGARNVEEFWKKLRAGAELLTAFSEGEVADAGVDAKTRADPNYVRAGGAIDAADAFDAAFFKVTPRDAELMDPQHRVFLECAFAALEDAGYDPARFAGRIGVFGGSAMNTYVLLHGLPANPQDAFQLMIQNAGDYLATRVSFKLNLRGPSVCVQTACSTSLVAIHVACQSLLTGECDIALAGGVSLRFPMRAGYLHQPGGIASPDGHCRPFDARAQGTVLGNGVGLVVLRRMADALEARDHIVAVVKGSAINNDGGDKAGYTAPSAAGQAKVITEAQLVAGVEPSSIGYVEAHGTGTPLGDLIEVSALSEAFAGCEPGHRCALGSVKSNVGHLDAAAGVTGFIKAALALQHGEIPKTVHFERENPQLGLARTPFYVPETLRAWQATAAPRRAGVSSFGIGGTNAHVVLEEAPPPATAPSSRRTHVLLLSAKSAPALGAMTRNLADALERTPSLDLADVAFTLQEGRQAFPYRRAIAARDLVEAVAALRAEADVEVGPSVSAPPVAFMFPGQGTQHLDMGRALYESEPAFRSRVDECAEQIAPLLGVDLRALLCRSGIAPGDEARLRDTDVAQPALFTIEYALAKWLETWGVRPHAMIGHSVGEYVAACLSSVLPFPDALALVVERGRLMKRLPTGSMLAVSLSEQGAHDVLSPEISLAAVNGPSRCVLAGPTHAIERLERRLLAEGVGCRRLHTSHAFHSSMMEPAVSPYRERVARVRVGAPSVPYSSNVTGGWITAAQVADPSYWSRHLRETVRFGPGLAELFRASRPGVLFEVGPGRALTKLAQLDPELRGDAAVLPLLSAPEGASHAVEALRALGEAWARGVDVSWSNMYAGEERRRVPLPTYPFERQRFWFAEATPRRRADAGAPRRAEELPPAAGPRRAPVVPPRTEVEARLVEIWKELFGLADVGIDDDFVALGGDSLLAVQMIEKIAKSLDVRLPIEALMDAGARTIAALARRVDVDGGARPANGAPGAPAGSLIVELRQGRGAGALFCVPGAGGTVFGFDRLAACLGDERRIYGFRALGINEGEEPLTSVEAIAAAYVEELKRVQPQGPYAFVGLSFGGVVALEMAQRLSAKGDAIALLAPLDSPIFGHLPRPMRDDAELIHYVSGDDPDLHPDRLRGRELASQIDALLGRMEAKGQMILSRDQVQRFMRVWKANMDALNRYVPRPYDAGPITFFLASEKDHFNVEHPELGWIDLASRSLRVQRVPGSHRTLLDAPHVGALARYLREALDDGFARARSNDAP